MKKLLALFLVGGLLSMVTGCPPASSTPKATPKGGEMKGDKGGKKNMDQDDAARKAQEGKKHQATGKDMEANAEKLKQAASKRKEAEKLNDEAKDSRKS